MRGRKPYPSASRRLRGNPSRRPMPQNEPTPDPAIPEKPSWLDPEACAEWDRVVPELRVLGILTRLDRGVLVEYCQAWSHVVELERDRRDSGWWVPTADGSRKRNPTTASLREAYERLRSAASELGLTPAARVRLATPGGSNGDELDELLSRRRRAS